jgi:hypothetical protein
MPAEDAPLVAGFFVTHQDAYYVKHMHQVWLLLRDAAKLHTEWVTGRKMTGAQARQAETHDSNVQAAQDYYRQKHGGAS